MRVPMRNVSMRSASLDARQDADIRCRARAVGDDMRGTLPAECLALTTGIFPKKPPSVADVARALKLHKRVESAIIEFLAEGKPQRFEWTRPPQQEELHMDLVTPVDGLSWQAEHLPLEVLPQWLMVVNQARKYCADKWPIYNADGLQPANYALADDELGDIWELVRAVEWFGKLLKANSIWCAPLLGQPKLALVPKLPKQWPFTINSFPAKPALLKLLPG